MSNEQLNFCIIFTLQFSRSMALSMPTFDRQEWIFLLKALDLDLVLSSDSKTMEVVARSVPSPRKPKCEIENCANQVQSRRRCKRHGGGSRCKVPTCTKPRQSRGYCHKHGGEIPCRVSGCTKSRQKRGLCAAHGGLDECQALGCKNRVRRRGLCRRHASAGDSVQAMNVLSYRQPQSKVPVALS